MKINNKQMIIIIVAAVVILVAFYTYSAKGVMYAGEVDGYLVLIDKEVRLEDSAFLREKMFSTMINLPGESCEGTVSYCSYEFSAGVNSTSDLNNDGKIDATDLNIFQDAFGCSSTQACWDEPVERCFYTVSGRRFKDPTYDCNMTQADMAIFQKQGVFGSTVSQTCELSTPVSDACRADVNKDGIVNMYDGVLIASNYGKYADTFVRLVEHKSQADIDKNGQVDIYDAILISDDYGKEATNQQCINIPLTHVDKNKYGISITARGLYFAGVTYSCKD